MELRQLEAFVAVAQAGSFTAAAERLGVVQPAVSQAVRRLEAELGLILFERTSRRVAPTAAGTAFLPHAEAVLQRLAEARAAARALAAGEAGTIRIAGTGGGADTVRRLQAALAGTTVRVELARVQPKPKLQAVLDGDLDAALMRSAPDTPGIAYALLDTQPTCAVVADDHPLASRASIAPDALQPFPLAVIARRDPERRRAEIAAAVGFAPLPGPALASSEEIYAAIATSTAWTLTSVGGGGPGTVELDLDGEVEPVRMWLAHRTDPGPAVRRLLEAIR